MYWTREKWDAGGIRLGAPVVGPALWIYSIKAKTAESRSDDRRSQEWATLELAQRCPNCPKWGWTIENGKLKIENEKHKTLCSMGL